VTERRTNSAWGGEQPLQSSLPHIIVDATGARVRPLPEFPPFPNRTQATKALNRIIEAWDHRRHGPEDPRTWRVQPQEAP